MGTPVKTLVIHELPHLDELVACIMAREFGSKIWPGIQNASITTIDGSEQKSRAAEWYLENCGELWIGVGEGEFDEHAEQSQPDTCAADLVASHLGINRQERVAKLLKYIRREDTSGHSSPLDLAQCIKLMNFAGYPPSRIEQWVATFIKPYLSATDFPVKEKEHRNLMTLFKRWLVSNHYLEPEQQISDCADMPELKQLCRHISILTDVNKRQPSQMFDLPEGVALLNTLGVDSYPWVETVFEVKVAEQREFLDAIKIVKQSSHSSTIRPKGYRILTVPNCDNQRLLPATRMLDPVPHLAIFQRTDGHISIFLPNEWKQGNPLPRIIRTLRLEEQIRDGIPYDIIVTDYDELTQPGMMDGAEAWYYFTNGQGGRAIFNGSQTRHNVPVTLLSINQVYRIVVRCLSVKDNKQAWQRFADKRLSRKKAH